MATFDSPSVPPAKKQKFSQNSARPTAPSRSSSAPERKQPAGDPTSSARQQRKALPVYQIKEKFLEHFKKNQTLIIIGETGSGKTTQIPQIIIDSDVYKFKSDPGKNNYGRCIACTQPRRVAAQSVAERVNVERGAGHKIVPKNGTCEVGYCIRFDDKSDTFRTKIRYMTDGMLVRESMKSDMFSRYSCIILDEAHERNVNTDVLITLLRHAQIQRLKPGFKGYPLKIIIMSATMDVDNFKDFFTIKDPKSTDSGNNKLLVPPVLYVEGRQFPIDLYYLSKSPEDHVQSVISAIYQIHTTNPDRSESILAFLTGQDEIEATKRQLLELYPDDSLFIVPLYAALPVALQMKAFQEPPKSKINGNIKRKVILATNIAETSITVSGIKHVIDSGKSKSKKFENGIDLLKIGKISKAEAWQRAGRTGRSCAGKVYRLYSEEEFEGFTKNIIPEIKRVSISSTLLYLYGLGKTTKEVYGFRFIDMPNRELYQHAISELECLNAVENGKLTEIGKKMTNFPLEPKLSRLLLYGHEHKTMSEILSIVSCLSADNIFNHYGGGGAASATAGHKEKLAEIQSNQAKFYKPEGDCLTLLDVYRSFNKLNKDKESQISFCREHNLNSRSLRHACTIRKQLREICQSLNLDWDSSQRENLKVAQKCIYLACKSNLAELDVSERLEMDDNSQHLPISYVSTRKLGRKPNKSPLTTTAPTPESSDAKVQSSQETATPENINRITGLRPHPATVVAYLKMRPKYLVYIDILKTSCSWMRICTPVEEKWVDEESSVN